MSVLTAAKPENISSLLAMDDEYPAPEIVASNVIQKDWLGECARAQKDTEAFWGDYAARFCVVAQMGSRAGVGRRSSSLVHRR